MFKTIHSNIAKAYEQDYLARFNACRASLRNLILMSEKLDPDYNRGMVAKLQNHFDAVDAAFKVMEVKKPKNNKSTKDDRYIQSWIDRDAEVPADYGEK